jgi:hypothetical protein
MVFCGDHDHFSERFVNVRGRIYCWFYYKELSFSLTEKSSLKNQSLVMFVSLAAWYSKSTELILLSRVSPSSV